VESVLRREDHLGGRPRTRDDADDDPNDNDHAADHDDPAHDDNTPDNDRASDDDTAERRAGQSDRCGADLVQ
jgi:hypothetical protein